MQRITQSDGANTSLLRTVASSTALGFVLSMSATFSSAYADDTEVFFGQVDPNTNVHPNVMFVLDTSGSMNSNDSGYSGTRLERMKSALNTILDTTTNANVGLMRFNGYYGGGSVLYPVTNVEQPICPNNDCGSVVVSSQIAQNDDDMEQFVANGQMTPGGYRLSMGQDGSNSQLVGYRFQNLNIPSGATITSATIEFTAQISTSNTSNLVFEGHNVDDAPVIGTNSEYLTDSVRTSSNVSWSPGSWNSDSTYQSPDLSPIVQELANRNGWCGGQSMGFVVSGTGERAAYSYNNSASRSAILRVTYDSTSIPANKGCMKKTVLSQIESTTDDAFEKSNTGRVITNSSRLRMAYKSGNNPHDRTTRLRFTKVAVPQGALIESAKLQFEVEEQRGGQVNLTIEAENLDDAPETLANNYWISSRPKVPNSVAWAIADSDNWGKNTKVDTPDLATMVQNLVDRPGWQSENDMAFIISNNGSTKRRDFESFEGEQPAAPKLQIVYKANVGSANISQTVYNTARDDMKEVVNGLKATGGTPIVAAYYEAVQYMLGGSVDYGRTRGVKYYYNSNSYSDQRHGYHRVSHPDSYTGGNVPSVSNCSANNPDSGNCRTEKIEGTPVYDSPLADSCQTNHIVFLSDGVPTSNTAAQKVRDLLNIDSCANPSGNEHCGRELATWLDETDHNENISRTQNISTYTIGFNINSSFLEDLAQAGGGTYYEASSSAQLVAQFQNILGDVLSVDTSFVAPGATVNQFNRLTHRNDIYFALFKPGKRPGWHGNLKRYHVGENSGGEITIQGQNNKDAVDEETGFFAADAHSWWSDSPDGSSVPDGGAANEMSLAGPGGNGNRRIFTFTGSSVPTSGVDLTASAQALHESNSSITESLLGLTSGNSVDRAAKRLELLKWARGVDVRDEDADDDTSDVRNHIGDPMHARPVLLNYPNDHTTIFLATNEGVLHAIEQQQGSEIFAFMPKNLLENLNPYFENQQSTKHPYGLDGDLSAWHDDKNENVIIDAGEKAYLFVGMRRGGSDYYAFDVSDRMNPKLMWHIEGGSGDFAQLGQSWSKAVPTSIMINNQVRDVLIFGGGYDVNQDPNGANLTASQSPDSIGNAIYIVDANTGSRLWVGQGVAGGDKQFNDMDYSIPSDIRVIDVDTDGLADQMYVGDMGGQMWRFDFEPYHQSGQLVYGGVMAKLNGGGKTNARRFYNEPDVALIAREGQRFLSVSFGSGWRAHPLNEIVDDRFYMLRSNSIYSKPEGYGKNTGSASASNWNPVKESDLANVTNDLDPPYNPYGWMLELETSGEKVLSNSITVNGQLVFTSYEPAASGDACSPAVGGGAIYVVDVLNGAPTLDLDGSDDDSDDGMSQNDDENGNEANYGSQSFTKEDRKKKLNQDGIPPAPTALITETDGKIGTTILVSTEQPVDVDFDDLTQRTYWQDNGRGAESPAEITASTD